MKKSRSITLTLMAGLAAACSDGGSRTDLSSSDSAALAADTVRRCVDAEQRIVSDEECTRPRSGGGFYPYFFYFGGRTFTQGGGTYVAGGSRTMPAPVRGPVSRGGIGATGARRSGSIGA